MRTCLSECVLISTLLFAFPRIINRDFRYRLSLSRLSHPHSSEFVPLADIVFSVSSTPELVSKKMLIHCLSVSISRLVLNSTSRLTLLKEKPDALS